MMGNNFKSDENGPLSEKADATEAAGDRDEGFFPGAVILFSSFAILPEGLAFRLPAGFPARRQNPRIPT